MKFTVLMSVYAQENHKNFTTALESILINQTVIPDEFVLVCDGPLNAELDAVISRFHTNFPDIFKVYRLEHNGGLGNALNVGMKLCQNEIIARADSDDICDSQRFEKQLDFLCVHLDVAAVGTAIDEFNTDWTTPVYTKEMPLSFDDIKKMSRYRNPLNHMTVMFRKSAVIKAGSYIPLPYVEDYYLWVRLMASGFSLANMGEVLVHARIGNGMLKRRANKEYIASWKVLNQYKLAQKQINRFEYIINWILVRIFVCEPLLLRKCSYKIILRRVRE